ncbi:MAG: Gfo/Idh/MocA family oxidoreductase [archaeon]
MVKEALALVGAGYWGSNYIKTLRDTKEADLRWVCDSRNPKIAIPSGTRFTQNYREVLDDSEVRGVVIATPTNTHYELAKEALEAGKHVLVEKPMTHNVERAIGLVDIAEKSGKQLLVGHTFLYNPAVQQLKSYIDDGELGRILSMSARRLSLGPIRDKDNVLWDLAPHDISMFLYLTDDKVKSVNATGASLEVPKQGLEDIITLSLNFDKGVYATLTASWMYPLKMRDLVVVGDKKMAIFDDIALNKLAIYDKGVEEIGDVNLQDYSITCREGEIRMPKVIGTSPLEVECSHFIKCIREGIKPLSDGKIGLEVVRVLSAAQQSLKNNGEAVFL